jgi:hypothetical protein
MLAVRRALLIALAVVAAGALLALPASASSAGRNSTKIVVSLKFPAFHGKLTSSRKGCLGSRRLKMFRQRNGKTRMLGTDTSEKNGRWAIPVGKRLTSGTYFATVAKRGPCKAAKSRLVPID